VAAGRQLDTNDHLSALPNVVVSRKAAALLWPKDNALGKRLKLQGLDTWWSVVGVVDDVMQDNFRDQANPLIYLPLAGVRPVSSPAYVVKSTRAETIAPDIRAIVRQVAPEAPMYRMYTMAALSARTMVGVSFTMMTLGVAAVLALILGAVGLYGVLSYVVAERTREIGVRMALGARAEQVRAMVVAQGTRVVGAGVLIGIVVAFAVTRALGSLLFGVGAIDAATFIAMSACMIVVGLLASYLPALRASRVDPIISLRGE
jgi:ABC-type lipoprotein release transport system permease subunit